MKSFENITISLLCCLQNWQIVDHLFFRVVAVQVNTVEPAG